jgi:hypothetical protein
MRPRPTPPTRSNDVPCLLDAPSPIARRCAGPALFLSIQETPVKRSLASLANLASLVAPIVVGIAAALPTASSFAGDNAAAAKSTYEKERADCEAGRTAEDRATCLKEAGAAAAERKRNTLDNTGSARQNAIDRCNLVAPKDKTDCLARIEGPTQSNQKTTTSGSVAGGGVLRETTTTTTGEPTVIMVPGAPAPAASATQ